MRQTYLIDIVLTNRTRKIMCEGFNRDGVSKPYIRDKITLRRSCDGSDLTEWMLTNQ